MKEYRVIEVNTGKCFTVWAYSTKEAFNKASKEYKKQYGIYPSNKEYKIL